MILRRSLGQKWKNCLRVAIMLRARLMASGSGFSEVAWERMFPKMASTLSWSTILQHRNGTAVIFHTPSSHHCPIAEVEQVELFSRKVNSISLAARLLTTRAQQLLAIVSLTELTSTILLLTNGAPDQRCLFRAMVSSQSSMGTRYI